MIFSPLPPGVPSDSGCLVMLILYYTFRKNATENIPPNAARGGQKLTFFRVCGIVMGRSLTAGKISAVGRVKKAEKNALLCVGA